MAIYTTLLRPVNVIQRFVMEVKGFRCSKVLLRADVEDSRKKRRRENRIKSKYLPVASLLLRNEVVLLGRDGRVKDAERTSLRLARSSRGFV